MGDKTKIAWTDSSWNPLRGCSKVSAGCKNCYAETMAARFAGPGGPYEGVIEGRRWNGQIRLVPEHLDDPLRWRRPRRVFVTSMSDPFHSGVPRDYLDRIFAVIALADHHTYQLLTKRPENASAYFADPETPWRIMRAIDAVEVDIAMHGVGEEWRPVASAPAYEVSNHGKVRRGGRELALSEHSRGYRQVALSVAGVARTTLVHSMVLEAFSRPGREGEEAAHQNGDKADNRVTNLRWATRAENMADASRHGTAGVWMRSRATLSPEDVASVREDRSRGDKLAIIAARYGIDKRQVSAIATGKILRPAPITWPLPNLHLYVSAEDQATADERIPILFDTPAAVRGVSLEPLLGPIDFRRVPGLNKVGSAGQDIVRNFHVIVGGESGPGARPCDVAWIRRVVEQCKVAGVPCFVKQLGTHAVQAPAEALRHLSGAAACSAVGTLPGAAREMLTPLPMCLKHPKGGNMAEWPADLRVQEDAP